MLKIVLKLNIIIPLLFSATIVAAAQGSVEPGLNDSLATLAATVSRKVDRLQHQECQIKSHIAGLEEELFSLPSDAEDRTTIVAVLTSQLEAKNKQLESIRAALEKEAQRVWREEFAARINSLEAFERNLIQDKAAGINILFLEQLLRNPGFASQKDATYLITSIKIDPTNQINILYYLEKEMFDELVIRRKDASFLLTSIESRVPSDDDEIEEHDVSGDEGEDDEAND